MKWWSVKSSLKVNCLENGHQEVLVGASSPGDEVVVGEIATEDEVLVGASSLRDEVVVGEIVG